MAFPRFSLAGFHRHRASTLAVLLLVTGVCCWLLLATAGAVSAKPMSLEELVSSADIVFVGTVTKTESTWNPERTRIYTHTTFQVEEYLKGSGSTTIVIRTLGGLVGEVGMMAPGTPVFRPNEKNVLFVRKAPQAEYHHVVGWAQGRFQVKQDPQSGEQILSRSLGGVSFVGKPSKEFESLRSLVQLKEAIRRQMEVSPGDKER